MKTIVDKLRHRSSFAALMIISLIGLSAHAQEPNRQLEKPKEEEAQRLSAEAAKPIKTFKYQKVFRGGTVFGDSSSRYILTVFQTTFETRPDAPIELNDWMRQYLALFNCAAFQRARLEGQWIREIHTDGEVPMKVGGGKVRMFRMNAYYRFSFESAAAAADALTEIQRVCKGNP